MKGWIRKLQATGNRVPLLQLAAGLGFHVFDISPAGRELRLAPNLGWVMSSAQVWSATDALVLCRQVISPVLAACHCCR